MSNSYLGLGRVRYQYFSRRRPKTSNPFCWADILPSTSDGLGNPYFSRVGFPVEERLERCRDPGDQFRHPVVNACGGDVSLCPHLFPETGRVKHGPSYVNDGPIQSFCRAVLMVFVAVRRTGNNAACHTPGVQPVRNVLSGSVIASDLDLAVRIAFHPFDERHKNRKNLFPLVYAVDLRGPATSLTTSSKGFGFQSDGCSVIDHKLLLLKQSRHVNAVLSIDSGRPPAVWFLIILWMVLMLRWLKWQWHFLSVRLPSPSCVSTLAGGQGREGVFVDSTVVRKTDLDQVFQAYGEIQISN
ncbi:hypothetical protein CROQUDRAFT_110491 [Cronartium quercuum f. sp. fusiforme G11]|uniref:Uncharacterized protein n=1 Tax=Cronartium quercuum f. sp. fusiforme G11 TaxID=708437 RepID=A0A9P6N7S7_9BASI|nr:hypothetical protein CROQUDRAFT_110491 [Cronartium quercuum f. sp. fusiforme G11]